MIFPDIVNYLLTLRYPGAESGKTNWLCYHGVVQVIAPFIAPGQTISYTVQPLEGVHAWIGYGTVFGPDTVPNTIAGTIHQAGAIPYSGIGSQALMANEIEGFLFITQQEPMYYSITNISPLGQRFEVLGTYLVVPTPQDMVTILDALRRLHTSTESERLLQQAVNLLGVLSGQPQEPRPSIGGS